MEQKYLYKFVLVILLPLLMIALISFNFGFTKIGIGSLLLLADGVLGTLRVYRHNFENKKFNTGDLKIISTKYFPFGRYVAILIFGVLFHKSTKELPLSTKDHEMCHKVQGFETGYFLFYTIYVLEWIYWTIKLIITLPKKYFVDKKTLKELVHDAYGHQCFEQEAKAGNKFIDYKNRRYHYAWLDFLFNDDDSQNVVSIAKF